jgi:hypothetical protein
MVSLPNRHLPENSSALPAVLRQHPFDKFKPRTGVSQFVSLVRGCAYFLDALVFVPQGFIFSEAAPAANCDTGGIVKARAPSIAR